MSRMITKKSLIIFFIFLSGVTIWSCTNNKLDRPETTTYTGPGSFYSMVMNNDGTFTVSVKENYSDASAFMTIEGTFESVGNGVTEYTVESATTTGPASEAPQKGDKAYGMEAIGFGMFLLPLGGNEVIPMMIQGDCPTADFTANWVTAQNTGGSDSTDVNSDFFGTFSYNGTTGEGEVVKKRNLVDFAQVTGGGSGVFSTESCEDGFLQISAGDDTANMWLTANGGAMVETFFEGQRNSTIFALPRDSNELADLEGTFRGIVVNNGGDPTSDSENLFAELEFDGSGNGTGRQITSINPWELGDEGVVFSLEKNSSVGSGWYTGTMEFSEGGSPTTANVGCAFTQNLNDSGQDIMLCTAQQPEGTNTMTMLFMKDSN